MTRSSIVVIALLHTVAGCSSRDQQAAPSRPQPQAASKAPAPPRQLAKPVPSLSLKVVDTCTIPGDPDEGKINTAGNVAYGKAAQQKLDIAWPKGKGPFPLIVIIHGGGWFSGDKEELGAVIEKLAGAGYAAVSLNYRLSTGAKDLFPACVEDARCALRWLRGQASRYAIDPRRVAVAGQSAGGQIAALLALAENVAGLDGASCSAAAQPAGVRGAVTYYAPSDLRSSSLLGSGEKETLPRLFGKEPEKTAALSALASPITHVHAGAPPMLLIHGTDDQTTPVSHSRKLKAALDAARVPSLLVELTAGHDFPMLSDKAEYLRPSCTALAFFEAVLK